MEIFLGKEKKEKTRDVKEPQAHVFARKFRVRTASPLLITAFSIYSSSLSDFTRAPIPGTRLPMLASHEGEIGTVRPTSGGEE